jgi:hypothetical protein
MVRTTVKSSSAYVSIAIPPNYIGKELEVIVYDKNEGLESFTNGSKKKVSFEALSIDTKKFKFNRDEANER